MFFENIIVKQPKGTKINTRNDNKYVYHVVSKTYNSDKKYVTEKKELIGKLCKDNVSYMNPNEKYFIFYPNEETNRLKEFPKYSDTVSVGFNVAINKLISELGIDEIVENNLGSSEIDGVTMNKIIQDLVAYFITEETSVIQHYSNYARKHAIVHDEIINDSFISEMLKNNITETKISKFLNEWCHKAYKGKGVYISYDSTNINTQGEGVDLAEYGHAKDNENLKQINISCAIDQSNNIPLFFEVYKGSIVDVSEFLYMVEKAKEYGMYNISFLADRGYFSKENITELRTRNHDFLLMVKTNNNKVKNIINEYKNLIISSKNYIAYHDVYGITIKSKLFYGDYEDTYFHIYQSDLKKVTETSNLLQQIYKLGDELESILSNKVEINHINRYTKYYNLEFEEGLLKSYSIKSDEIDDITKNYGFFVIVTSKEMTAKEAIDIYRNRDVVEKLFRMIKTELGYNTFRVYDDKSVISKTFLIFIASIIRCEIKNKLIKLYEKDKKTYTVNSSVRLLDQIEITKNSKDKYVLKYAATAKQKNVLLALNIKEHDIIKAVSTFNSRF